MSNKRKQTVFSVGHSSSDWNYLGRNHRPEQKGPINYWKNELDIALKPVVNSKNYSNLLKKYKFLSVTRQPPQKMRAKALSFTDKGKLTFDLPKPKLFRRRSFECETYGRKSQKEQNISFLITKSYIAQQLKQKKMEQQIEQNRQTHERQKQGTKIIKTKKQQVDSSRKMTKNSTVFISEKNHNLSEHHGPSEINHHKVGHQDHNKQKDNNHHHHHTDPHHSDHPNQIHTHQEIPDVHHLKHLPNLRRSSSKNLLSELKQNEIKAQEPKNEHNHPSVSFNHKDIKPHSYQEKTRFHTVNRDISPKSKFFPLIEENEEFQEDRDKVPEHKESFGILNEPMNQQKGGQGLRSKTMVYENSDNFPHVFVPSKMDQQAQDKIENFLENLKASNWTKKSGSKDDIRVNYQVYRILMKQITITEPRDEESHSPGGQSSKNNRRSILRNSRIYQSQTSIVGRSTSQNESIDQDPQFSFSTGKSPFSKNQNKYKRILRQSKSSFENIVQSNHLKPNRTVNKYINSAYMNSNLTSVSPTHRKTVLGYGSSKSTRPLQTLETIRLISYETSPVFTPSGKNEIQLFKESSTQKRNFRIKNKEPQKQKDKFSAYKFQPFYVNNLIVK